MGLEEEYHKGDSLSSSSWGSMLLICLISGEVYLDQLVKAGFARFFYCKVISLFKMELQR